MDGIGVWVGGGKSWKNIDAEMKNPIVKFLMKQDGDDSLKLRTLFIEKELINLVNLGIFFHDHAHKIKA